MAGPIQSSISQSISTVGQFIGLAKLKEGQEKQVKASNVAAIKAFESEKNSRAMLTYQQDGMVKYLDAKDKTELAKEKANTPLRLNDTMESMNNNDEARLDSEVGNNFYETAFGQLVISPYAGKYIKVGDTTLKYGDVAIAMGDEYANELIKKVEENKNIPKDELTNITRNIYQYHKEAEEADKYWTEYYSTPEGIAKLEEEVNGEIPITMDVTRENIPEAVKWSKITDAKRNKEFNEAIGASDGKESPEMAKMKANFINKNKRYYVKRRHLGDEK